MSETKAAEPQTYPLTQFFLAYPEPRSMFEEDRQYEGLTLPEIEARRREQLALVLQSWKDGKHPIFVMMEALEVLFGGHDHPLAFLPFNARYAANLDAKAGVDDIAAEKKRMEEVMAYGMNLLHKDMIDNPPHARIDEFLKALTKRKRSAYDITASLAPLILRDPGYSGSVYQEIFKKLEQQREDEIFDHEVLVNDQYATPDICKLIEATKPTASLGERMNDHAYRDLEEINIDRTVALTKVLERWREGGNPLVALMETANAIFSSSRDPLGYVYMHASNLRRAEKEERQETLRGPDMSAHNARKARRERANFNRLVRKLMQQMPERIMAYKGPAQDEALAAEIDAFIQNIEKTDQTPYSIAESIFEVLLFPVEESHEASFDVASPLLTKLRSQIYGQRGQEEREFADKKPGALETQTEDDLKKGRLSRLFKRRARMQRNPKYKALERLCNVIEIDASGTGLIKPYPTYDDGSGEEEMYGTTIARITTYAVKLTPKNPDDLRKLGGFVKAALRRIAGIRAAFEIPFDLDARRAGAYKRPNRSYYDRSASFSNDDIVLKDGQVHIHNRLDLDDLWNLYYLLEDVIEPTAQIAGAFDRARREEERGTLMRKEDIGDHYGIHAVSEEDRLGNLQDVKPEDYLQKALEQTFLMRNLKTISHEEMLERLIILASHTLQGTISDPHGAYPVYRLLEDRSKEKGDMITYDDALKERTLALLAALAGVEPDVEKAGLALSVRVAQMSKPIRKAFRKNAINRFDADMEKFDAKMEGRYLDLDEDEGEGGLNMMDVMERALKLSDAFAGIAGRDEEAAKEARKTALAHRANITLRDSPVGACIDRSWHGTKYVSRSKYSPYVRYELPKSLQPFMSGTTRAWSDLRQMALTFKG